MLGGESHVGKRQPCLETTAILRGDSHVGRDERRDKRRATREKRDERREKREERREKREERREKRKNNLPSRPFQSTSPVDNPSRRISPLPRQGCTPREPRQKSSQSTPTVQSTKCCFQGFPSTGKNLSVQEQRCKNNFSHDNLI